MRLRLARLFTIKTRTEAYLITYAIAVGAIERGLHYMELYPGYGGVLLALACLGVPFIAGAKLIDSVKPQPALAKALAPLVHRRSTSRLSRSRPMYGPSHRGSALRASRRRD